MTAEREGPPRSDRRGPRGGDGRTAATSTRSSRTSSRRSRRACARAASPSSRCAPPTGASASVATSRAAAARDRSRPGHGCTPRAGRRRRAGVRATRPAWRARRRSATSCPRPTAEVGRSVRSGDLLGHVEMLGIHHDVPAPVDGVVIRALAASGQAVEYGQPLVLVEAGGSIASGPGSGTEAAASGHRRGSGPTRPRPRLMFERILIANRGEIALRILRACRTLGVEAVVAHSEADRELARRDDGRRGDLHRAGRVVALVPVGRRDHLGRPRERLRRDPSRLRLPLRGRRLRRDDARPRPRLHRPAARGPRALRVQGWHARAARPPRPPDRSRARTGCCATTTTPSRRRSASAIPVLIKPSAGGGGKGMRLVRTPRELQQALTVCRSEARAAFGDDSLYLEKWLEETRHVEVQVVVDRFGAGVHVGERDCSVQRRHQKIVEEGPSPAIDDATRDAARGERDRARSSRPATRTSARSSSSSTATVATTSSRSTRASRSSIR